MNPIQAEDAGWQEQIRQLQDYNREAFLAQDIERLTPLWADDLLVNSPINRVHTKSQVLDLLQRGIIRHVFMEEHIEVMQRYGDLVVVMGYDRVANAPDEAPIPRRFTNVWREKDGSWQLIARHAQHVVAP